MMEEQDNLDLLQRLLAQLPQDLQDEIHNLSTIDPTVDCVFKAILGSEELR